MFSLETKKLSFMTNWFLLKRIHFVDLQATNQKSLRALSFHTKFST